MIALSLDIGLVNVFASATVIVSVLALGIAQLIDVAFLCMFCILLLLL